MSDFQENPFGGQENIFTSATQGKFFRPKETGYKETPKRVKIIWLVVIVVLLVAVAVFIALRATSFERVLESADLDDFHVVYLDKYDIGDRNHSDDNIVVFYTKTISDGNLALVYATRDFWGFWSIEEVVRAQDKSGISMSWEGSQSNQFAWDTKHETVQCEYHYAYVGQDALKKIEINREQLPENAAVSVWQFNNEYRIHVVHFSTKGEANIDFTSILRENGCIQ